MLKSIDFENKLDIKKFKRGKYINSWACGDVYQSKYNNRNVISKRLNIKDYYDYAKIKKYYAKGAYYWYHSLIKPIKTTIN